MESQHLGPYELSARLAKGGMAEIWVAANEGRQRRDVERVCVVKRLLPQYAHDEEHIQMFLEECRLAAAFDHPNVVRTFDFGTANGEPYLAMEYLHGEDLRTVLRHLKREGKRVPRAHAITIMRHVAAGLHHAHEAKSKDGEPLHVVHRDVSPHNVFITFDGRVKIVDFGIAKSRDRRWETKHGTLKGKVPYMSPEQIKARRLDRRTDIYAAGVMLYELVLGKRPYILSATGDFAQMMAIARHDVVPPAESDPDIDPLLERILLGAMAYDPKDRYPTFERMLADLDAFAAAQRIDGSEAALAGLMESVFGARVDAWRAALADDDALTHVIALEEARALRDPEDDDEDVPTEARASSSVVPLAPPSASLIGTSPALAAVVEVDGVTVVTLRGKIDEAFEGAALGRSLHGTVLFDLDGIERVTSFGVREWIEMTKAMAESGSAVDAWLARCSEPIVTQLAHIRSFTGNAKLLSFHAPFLCNACGHAWSTTLDCERDAAWFSGAAQRDPAHAVVACERCGSAARLDDDPAFLSFAAPYAGAKVPPIVRRVLETIEQAARGARDWIEKVVGVDETRIRISRNIDPAARWPRLLDGIEGRLVVEFRGAPSVPRAAGEALVRALRNLDAREVTAISLVEAPLTVATLLAPSDRIVVTSMVVEGRCAGCAATRSGLARPSEIAAAFRSGAAPAVACRRCDGTLDLTPLLPALRALVGEGRTEPAIEAAPAPALVLPAAAPVASPSRNWLALAFAAAAFVLLIIAVAMKLHTAP